MAAPTLVGATYLSPTDNWSSSYTITSSDLPGGTANNDLLLLWFVGTNVTSSPLGGGWGLTSAWTVAAENDSFYLNYPYGFVSCFYAKNDGSALSQTVVPKTPSGTTITAVKPSSSRFQENWFAVLMAYRSNAELKSTGWYTKDNADGKLPGSGATDKQSSGGGFAGGTSVGLGTLLDTPRTNLTLETADSFTEQNRWVSSDTGTVWRNCANHIDRSFPADWTPTLVKPIWDVDGQTSQYGVGTFVVFGPSGISGWSVGQIKY